MNAMQTDPQTDPRATAPISYWRMLHDRLLADPALRRAAKRIDPGAFSLAGTSKRRDDAIWQAYAGMAETRTTADLIARLMEADSRSPPDKLEGNPVLGPVIARRDARYSELKRNSGFAIARIIANREAVQEIINGQH